MEYGYNPANSWVPNGNPYRGDRCLPPSIGDNESVEGDFLVWEV